MTKIKISIKTFHGDRKTYDFEVSILEKIYSIIDRLMALDDSFKSFFSVKLVYPMGYLRHLDENMNDSLLDLQIPDGAKLVLVGQKTFAWSTELTGPRIKLSNNNLTATNPTHEDFDGVYGDIAISEGKHYWEIKIQHIRDIHDIMIGVTDVNKYAQKPDHKRYRAFDRFWGWNCIERSKVRPSGQNERADFHDHYGQSCKIGDTIGCIMDFKDNLLQLTFTVNQVS